MCENESAIMGRGLKTMKNLLSAFAILLLASASLFAQTKLSDENPLGGFAWLVGKEWKSGSTIQEYKWGLEKLTVLSRSYVANNGKKVLVAEGYWYWHPEQKVIKGFFTAKGMPFYMIESEARISGEEIIHSLKTYSKAGVIRDYVETIKRAKGGSYEWRLYAGKAANGTAVMADRFVSEDPAN